MNILTPQATLLFASPLGLVVQAGRQSYQSHPKASEQSDLQLLRHFVKNDESPLEHSLATFDVTCSYGAHIHLVRHRHVNPDLVLALSPTFLSQRYTEGLGFILPPEVTDPEAERVLLESYEQAEANFLWLRELGLKKQAARYATSQGVAMRGTISGNARAWLKLLELRTAKKAMPETRLIAGQIRDGLKEAWPALFEET